MSEFKEVKKESSPSSGVAASAAQNRVSEPKQDVEGVHVRDSLMSSTRV